MELTLKERLLLANQYLILEKLYPNEADRYAQFRKALQNGYVQAYGELTQWFSEDELSTEECRKVMDILDMYRVMRAAHARLSDRAAITEHDVTFPGFDGNNESKHFSYAKYLIEDCGRWEEFKGCDLNTHSEMMPVYDRMLAAWNQSKDQVELTREDVLRILNANPWKKRGVTAQGSVSQARNSLENK
jgi:uncharacterized protein